MALLFLIKNPIALVLQFEEINESNNNGKDRPIPNERKLIILAKALVIKADFANKAAINAGLHGTTIAPKKNPYTKALASGFFIKGICAFGINLPMSMSKIRNKLIIAKILNAIGETIPITVVNDICKKVVNTRPSRSINKITPEATNNPNVKIGIFLFLVNDS